MFLQALSKRSNRISPFASQTYDAVWAIALALRAAEMQWHNVSTDPSNATTLGDFDYSRNDMTLEFIKQLNHLSFMGVSVGYCTNCITFLTKHKI